jgi:hypothetical protein
VLLRNKTNYNSRRELHLRPNIRAKEFNIPKPNSGEEFCKRLCQHNVNSSYVNNKLAYGIGTQRYENRISIENVLL